MSTSKPLRIVFAGTPEFAATNLQAVLSSRHKVIGVYTQPDRPAGRGQKLTASPVKQLAQQHDIPVYQPLSLRNTEAQAELASLEADLMVVVAYGLILPQGVLDTPRLGCINVHASILPRWRGAAPIHRAVLAGDSESGVTIMQMEAGLDTGPMLQKVFTPIAATETSGTLHDRLATLGADALLQVLEHLAEGPLQGEVQDDALATYAHKLEKEEGQLDWHLPAAQLDRQVRGLHPWPVAYTDAGDKRIRVLAASVDAIQHDKQPGTLLQADRSGLLIACGDGALRLTHIQLPGSRAMAVADVLNSRASDFPPGIRFGQQEADA